MPEDQKAIRKLRAILSADVKGYSLLMADDEAFTIQTLKAYRKIMSELIERHNGRVVDSPGDNILAEFRSAFDAVECAANIQRKLAKENSKFVEEKKVRFRIGVNVGDVIEDGDRIYGNGVNVAARIEGLAEPGGICISRNAYDHISDKLNYGYEYLGDHEVKNIKDPVRVYKVLMEPEDAGKLIGKGKKRPKQKWSVIGIAAVFIIGSVVVFWQFYVPEKAPDQDAIEQPTSTTEEKPSIAVLPFTNMSDDPEQEYFSDGMTDDIITDLSKIKDLLVISRNSTFAYKKQGKKIPEIAKELNVRYVLEGSVRKASNQIRINAQLIDSKTDHHVWAERFDGMFEDVFALQDRISAKIVSALAVKLSDREQKVISDKGTHNILAYDAYLKGMTHMRRFTPDDYVTAISYFEQAIELDQDYSEAYAALAYTYWTTFGGGRSFWEKIGIDYVTSRLLARYYLELAMKKPTSSSYQLMALMELWKRHYREAIEFAEKAAAISPNDADVLSALGTVMVFAENPKKGIEYYQKSMVIDPLDIGNLGIGMAYFTMEDFHKTIKYIDFGLTDNPLRTPHLAFYASAQAFLGNTDEAKKALDKWLGPFEVTNPSVQMLYYLYPFKNIKVFDRLIEGLVKAGYPVDPLDYYIVDENNKLTGQEIRELIFGKTQTGYLFGFPWSIFRNVNGELESTDLFEGIDKGKSWIEGDLLCNQFEKRYDGLKSCEDIYRNPDGDEINKSEYLDVTDFLIFPFSMEK